MHGTRRRLDCACSSVLQDRHAPSCAWRLDERPACGRDCVEESAFLHNYLQSAYVPLSGSAAGRA